GRTAPQPADGGPRAPARPPHLARDLRGDRGPGPAQAAARALQPRRRRSAARALQPRRRVPIGAARRGVPRPGQGRGAGVLPPPGRPRGARRAAGRRALHLGLLRRRRDVPALVRGTRRLRRDGRPEAQPRLLPLDCSGVLPGDRRGARPPRLDRERRRGGPGGHREAVRHHPGRGPRAQPDGARGARRVAGLPHRPLPGQGDRPEHAGLPLRQRHVRAAVEPELHRQRADHRRGGHRDRQPRGVLRQRGRAARSHAEPHDAAAEPAVHGAARRLLRRRGPQREGQGPPRDRAASARADGPRAVRGRKRRRHRGAGLHRRGRGARRLAHRDLRGHPPGRRELAMGRRAVLPAHGQAARAQGDRDRGDAAARAAPGVQPGGLGRRAAQPAHLHRPAQRGGHAEARREDPGHPDARARREHGVPLRHDVPLAVARGLREAHHGRDARRRDALHPQRRGGGAVAHHGPRRRALEARARAAAAVRGGIARPARGRRAAGRGGRVAGDL
ncbi:MAG: Glucose-6-phosphate 1-dehydrogenase, partial [uncultured Solirubrobacteraceae bacterium]